MSWDAVGAIGQVLGSVAVFITLIYLAIQIRHSREQARRAVTLSRLNIARENMWHLVHSPTLGIRVQLNRTLGIEPAGFVAAAIRLGATEEDALRIFYELLAGWMLFVFQVYNLNQMTATERDAVGRTIRATYGAGIGKLWYESYARTTADADVVRHVDAVLAQRD